MDVQIMSPYRTENTSFVPGLLASGMFDGGLALTGSPTFAHRFSSSGNLKERNATSTGSHRGGYDDRCNDIQLFPT
ncbi:hypothetical protein FRC12_002422 [Ceratobasidium sp. 428]|nr:hypothetical protein FRC12_002422 [Ceratobasidium sp. 428]